MSLDNNLNVLNDNIGVINNKVDAMLEMLNGHDDNKKLPPAMKEQEMERLRDKLFASDKKDDVALKRYKQKRKAFQAVPITIDSISLDGQKSLKKVLKNLFTFNIDKKQLEDKKTGIWGTIAALILGLLTGLVGFIMEKIKGLWDSLHNIDALKNLRTIFKDIRDSLWKSFKESKLGQVFSDIAKTISESKFGKFMRELKALRFWQTENFLNTLKEMKNFTQRIKELPKYLRDMNVGQLTEYIKKTKFKTGLDYGAEISKAQQEQISTLEKLLEFKKEGFKFNEMILALEEEIKLIDKPKPLFQIAIEGFGKTFSELFKSAGEALSFVGSKLEGAVKALEKIPGIGFIMKKIPYIGTIISSVDTLMQLVEKKIKGEKVDNATLTAAATTIALNTIGWFSSGVLFPLAFLTLKQLEPIIRNIYEAPDTLNKLGLAFAAVPEILYKAFGMTLKFFAADLPFWIGSAWDKMFGDKKEGPILLFFKHWSEELEDFFTNFSLGKELQNLGNMIGEGIAGMGLKLKDFLSSVLTKDFWKRQFQNYLSFDSINKRLSDTANNLEKQTPIEKTDIKVSKADDLISSNDKTLFSGRNAYKFNKSDEFFAVKKGGPVDNLMANFANKTNKTNEELIKEIKSLNKKFSSLENFYKESLLVQNKQLNAVTSHTPFLKDIRNKDFSSNNIIMANKGGRTVSATQLPSTASYRSGIARTLV
jgi:hypothetical protein